MIISITGQAIEVEVEKLVYFKKRSKTIGFTHGYAIQIWTKCNTRFKVKKDAA